MPRSILVFSGRYHIISSASLVNNCILTNTSSVDFGSLALFYFLLKDKDYCPIEIIKGLTDKGQFQYLTKLMGPQEGTYLYATQFHSLR